MLAVIFLLFFVVNVGNGQNPRNPNYPCGTKVLIGIDMTLQRSDLAAFSDEKEFLLHNVFTDDWVNFNNLSLVRYSHTARSLDFGEIKNRSMIDKFVEDPEWLFEDGNFCAAIIKIATSVHFKDAHIILFISDYPTGSSIDRTRISLVDDCWYSAVKIREGAASITFVILNYRLVAINWLDQMFPGCNYIWWDILHNDLPTNWESEFWRAFGCDVKTPTYNCPNTVLIGYDRSQNLTARAFESETLFISDYLLKRMNFYDNLALWSFAGTTVNTTDFGQLRNIDQLRDFVNQNKQTAEQIALCNTFIKLSQISAMSVHLILFASTFGKEKVDQNCEAHIKAAKTKISSVTFVFIFDPLIPSSEDGHEGFYPYFPEAKVIKWNAEGLSAPFNWQWEMLDSYGCTNDTSVGYPCDQKIIVAYDVSKQTTRRGFDAQINFLKTSIFTKDWNRFNQLGIMQYDAVQTVNTYYGMLDNLESVWSFVQAFNQTNNAPSFCKAMTNIVINMYPEDAHLVIFVSRFTKGLDEVKLNRTLSKITVIGLDTSVDYIYLATFFSNITIIKWNADLEPEPAGFRQAIWEGFGCTGLSPLIGTTLPPTHKTTKQRTSTVTPATEDSSTSHSITQLPSTSAAGTTPEPSNLALYLETSIPSAIVLFWIILIWFCLYRRKHKQKRERLKNALQGGYRRKTNKSEFELKIDDPWIIKEENVQVNYDKKIGSGAFSNVFVGKLLKTAPIKQIYPDVLMLAKFEDCKVAVKVLPLHADEFSRNDFQQEINFMKKLKFHQNVLCFLGYVPDSMCPLLVLEYCANADLLQFLRKNKEKFVENQDDGFKLKNLVSFAWQISSGLQHLSSLGHIHRDVAARNVLLDKHNICKLSDFGMCRTGESQIYTSRGGKLPIRWMSIESLRSFEYSTKSDVWAYGVLLFEVFSLGGVPYVNVENDQILSFLEKGGRMEKPAYCPDEIYEIMDSCWTEQPNSRPSFSEICAQLVVLLEGSNSQYNYVDAVRRISIVVSDSKEEEVTV